MTEPRYKSRKQYPDNPQAGTGIAWDQWNEVVDQATRTVVLSAVLDGDVIDITEALNKAYEQGREDERFESEQGGRLCPDLCSHPDHN